MSIRLTEEKVFKDPVHRYIHVQDKLLWDLIGTSEFQRLRRVRQLGTTSFTFHGAEHSRFNHSLGVYEIMRRLITNFSDKPMWNDEDRLLALSAALLHDIGHGPFSHSFEKVFDTDHEEWTRLIILGDTEVNEVLRHVHADFPKEVAAVIEKTSANKLVTSMISSQIDADRMDYLLRDAYYTGVSYGQFDLERILRVMRPMDDQVVVKASGMHAVEDYIMSRYQMYWQVYFHPVTRSSEVILSKILKRVKALHEEGYPFKQPPHHFESIFSGAMTINDYLQLDESVMHYYFQCWQKEDDPILEDLCHRFLNRRLFAYVECHPNERLTDIMALQELFLGSWNGCRLLFGNRFLFRLAIRRVQARRRTEVPIQLLMKNGQLKELSSESDVVESISGKKRTDHKLYYPADTIASLDSSIRLKIESILKQM